jgi:hypothetical protein
MFPAIGENFALGKSASLLGENVLTNAKGSHFFPL